MALLALRYPNGRTHEVELATELEAGDEFDLYGRRWRVVGRAAATDRRLRYRDSTPVVCRPLTPSPLRPCLPPALPAPAH
jgi:hypothetical protein